jgi:hypothetical protein
VGNVSDGDSRNLASRSALTIEDLKTKIGTFVNGTNIKGEKLKLKEESVELTIGKSPGKFRYVPCPFFLSLPHILPILWPNVVQLILEACRIHLLFHGKGATEPAYDTFEGSVRATGHQIAR